jgi:hypothetical protein
MHGTSKALLQVPLKVSPAMVRNTLVYREKTRASCVQKQLVKDYSCWQSWLHFLAVHAFTSAIDTVKSHQGAVCEMLKCTLCPYIQLSRCAAPSQARYIDGRIQHMHVLTSIVMLLSTKSYNVRGL